MAMKPSVGRVVHYVSYDTPDGAAVCRAAIVTDVPEIVDSTSNDKGYFAHLCVLNPEGTFFNKNVPMSAANNIGGTWHWPERVE